MRSPTFLLSLAALPALCSSSFADDSERSFSPRERHAIKKMAIIMRLMIYHPYSSDDALGQSLIADYKRTLPTLPLLHQLYFEGVLDVIQNMGEDLSQSSKLSKEEKKELENHYRSKLHDLHRLYGHDLNQPLGYHHQREHLQKMLAYSRPSSNPLQDRQANIALLFDMLASLKKEEKTTP